MRYRRMRRQTLSPAKQRMLKEADRLRLRADVIRSGIARSLEHDASNSKEIAAITSMLDDDVLPPLREAEALYDQVYNSKGRVVRTSVHRNPRAKAKKSTKTKS